MKLRRISITHLPGIAGGLVLDGFGPGITVVTGPNASGKSSVIRALRHLIDETAEPGGGALTLEAQFESNAAAWTVTRSGSEIVWQQAGRRVDRPPLPRGDFLQCYWLSLNDLLDESATDEQIRVSLRRALCGGFDLDSIRGHARFRVGNQHGRGQQARLRDCETVLQRVVRQYEALERDRQRLPQLEEAFRSTAAAAARANKADGALSWLDARRHRHSLDARLEGFPADIERLTGQEIERLHELEDRRQALVDARALAVQDESAALSARQATGFGDEPPDDTDLEIHAHALQEAHDASREIQQLRNERIAARALERTAAEALGVVPDARPALSPDAVDRAVMLAESLRQTERKVRELEALPVSEPVDASTLAAHDALANELRRWLRLLDPLRFRTLFGVGAAALALTIGATLTGAGVGAWLTATLAGLGGVATVWWLAQLIALNNARSSVEARAAELPLPPPDFWTAEAVTKRLNEVEQNKAVLAERIERTRDTDARRKELEPLRHELGALRASKERLASEVGFDPSKTAEGVVRFASLMADLDRAQRRVHELQLASAQWQCTCEDRARKVRDFLLRYGARRAGDADSVETLRAQLKSLERRVVAFRDAVRALEGARRTLQRLDAECADTDARIAALYRDAGLGSGEREALLERCGAVVEYRRLKKLRDEAMVLERERRKPLIGDEELIRLVDAEDETRLRELLADLRLRAQSLEPQRNEIADLKARLARAGEERELERAQQDRDDARDALRNAHEEAMRADAGLFLLDDIAAEYRHDQEPPVLAAARARFARYTNNRYLLQVEEDGRILARDNQRETVHTLETLSTGTRMQLLMAVRLAWTSMAEREAQPLPIFLDEALTTSDPVRFTSIARNLKATADEENRQIVYLSAEPADLVRWQRAIGEPPAHIDLASDRARGTGSAAPDYRLEEREPVPAPHGLTAEEYAARLGVPQVCPREGAGEIHVFHLLRDDPDLLHALLRDWHVTRLGPLATLLDSQAGVHAVPDDVLRHRLLGRCHAARAWVAAWRQGRGRPVDRNALEASGAVSGRFIESVTQLASQVDGDARRLLEALENREVANFQRGKIIELAEWLAEHGFVEDAGVLDRAGRAQRALLECAACASPEDIHMTLDALESSAAKAAPSGPPHDAAAARRALVEPAAS